MLIVLLLLSPDLRRYATCTRLSGVSSFEVIPRVRPTLSFTPTARFRPSCGTGMKLTVLTAIWATRVVHGQSWGSGRREDKKHALAWEVFAADLCRGDCTMNSLSNDARVMLPMGQVVSKEEYRLACASSMADATVGDTSIATTQLTTTDNLTFSVEAFITTVAIAPKSETKRQVRYPAAFFVTIDPRTNELTEVRMYAQNIGLLAARGYSMVPDSNCAPLIRPA